MFLLRCCGVLGRTSGPVLCVSVIVPVVFSFRSLMFLRVQLSEFHQVFAGCLFNRSRSCTTFSRNLDRGVGVSD